MLNECYQVTFRKKLYHSLEELRKDADMWISEYNTERPHAGKYCLGKTAMQTFLDSIEMAREIMIGYTLQTN